MTAEPHGPRRGWRWTVRRIRGARAAERRLRRFGFVSIERLLQLAALPLQAGESNDGLPPEAVQLAVVVRNRGHLAGNRVGARLQRIEQWGKLGARLSQQLTLRVEGIAFRTNPSGQL